MKHFQSSDGLSLAYDDQGDGVPVLCLAGLTRNMDDFKPFMAVTSGVRIIRLDTRGRGGSDHDPNPIEGYTLPVEARDAVELLDHLSLEKAVVVGTSRGGLIAMLLAMSVKDRLAGVLLNDIGPVLEDGALDVIKDYLGRRPAARTYAEAGAGLAQFYSASFPEVTAAEWAGHARAMYGQGEDGLTLRYDPALREAVMAGGAVPDLWPLFNALDGLPLAALRGAHSDLLSAETFAAMQAARPDMIAATVPGRGHVPFLDEPEAQAVLKGLMEKVDEHS
ncbi:alpha/beta fold hydrolase [Pontivivens insulae]|uniref:2-(Acetamidomethylene)succinate hydrolase n=1 Tax=Pontivivens insulae TaxID=1639689 RepID=A0A2R8AET0_9RHOB|nr:alpha/beta hydrolase [Pontivivens insulae]RED11793.1 pimeloyl-ACP methyl ester carboxylesterase [Pontivivens insulae]SPF30550.1 2-(acetamidomethylene)succinate hydrolase [Pontivivens insulae]